MTPLLKTSHLKVPLVIAAPFTVVVFTNALVIGPQPAVSAAILKLATGKGSIVTLTVCVFGQVFLKAQSSGNQARLRKIMDYVNKFENQEFAKLN